MARLAVALLGMALLVGCSTGGGQTQNDPSAAQRGEANLEGVTSDYSIRLAELPDYHLLGKDSALRDGLVAGDAAVHVAAAAFRVGDNFGLDLIVNNRGVSPLHLRREDVRLVDSSGQWMQVVGDFPRAEEHGLRSRIERPASSYPYDGLGLYDGDTYGSPTGYSSNPLGDKNPSNSPSEVEGSQGRHGLYEYEWESESPVAPNHLEVPGGEGRAWWAYWKSERPPVFPLTAFVTVEGRHMIFIFEE